MRTAPGSRCGNQTVGALSARRSGSTGKPEAPPQDRRFGKFSLVSRVAGSCLIVALVVGIAPQELPSQTGRVEFVQIGIGGRRPPVEHWRHILTYVEVQRSSQRGIIARNYPNAAAGESRSRHRVMPIRRRGSASALLRIAVESDFWISGSTKIRRSGLVHRGTQEIPVAVLGHPFGARQMALPGALRAFWLV